MHTSVRACMYAEAYLHVCICLRRQRDRHRHTHTHSQTDRQTDRHTHTHTHTHTHERHTCPPTYMNTGKRPSAWRGSSRGYTADYIGDKPTLMSSTRLVNPVDAGGERALLTATPEFSSGECVPARMCTNAYPSPEITLIPDTQRPRLSRATPHTHTDREPEKRSELRLELRLERPETESCHASHPQVCTARRWFRSG